MLHNANYLSDRAGDYTIVFISPRGASLST